MSDIKKCSLCETEINETDTNIEKITSGCNHDFHGECWNKMFSTEEQRLSCKSSRIHLWLALECPVCNERNFIDGHSITKTEYIDLLISEVSKQSKAYIKCSNEIEVLEEKYNNNNVKHKKFQDKYDKMTEYIAMNTINNNKLSFV